MSNFKFIEKNQDKLKQVWESGMKDMPRTHILDTGNSVSVVCYGYKVSRSYFKNYGFLYELLEIHSNEFYKWVKQKDLPLFVDEGFKIAAAKLQVKRHNAKIDDYTRKIEAASSDRNDSLVIHWRRKRKEITRIKTLIEENFVN